MSVLTSDRARGIQRMTEFEEDNSTRLMMKKKDTRGRKRDEQGLGLCGTGSSRGRRRGHCLEDELENVLLFVGTTKAGAIGDKYEELRQKAKKADALSQSRTRVRGGSNSSHASHPWLTLSALYTDTHPADKSSQSDIHDCSETRCSHYYRQRRVQAAQPRERYQHPSIDPLLGSTIAVTTTTVDDSIEDVSDIINNLGRDTMGTS